MAASSESPVGSAVIVVGASDSISSSQAGESFPLTPETGTESQPAESAAAEPSHIEVAEPPVQRDKLEEIVGIGPVFATRLQAAGIHTFAS